MNGSSSLDAGSIESSGYRSNGDGSINWPLAGFCDVLWLLGLHVPNAQVFCYRGRQSLEVSQNVDDVAEGVQLIGLPKIGQQCYTCLDRHCSSPQFATFEIQKVSLKPSFRFSYATPHYENIELVQNDTKYMYQTFVLKSGEVG